MIANLKSKILESPRARRRIAADEHDRSFRRAGAGGGRVAAHGRAEAVVAFNARYRDGMLTSIHAGIAALAADTRAAFVVLCDQPQLKATTLAKLRAAFEASGKGIVVPSHNSRRGHPLLIDLHKYRAEVMAIDDAPGLQTILRAHADDILHVEFDDPGVLEDVDTREDYQRATGRG
ncbi:MAG: NTP transferase domain-containing protein [Chloroflexi bacterium]|nr:NTP transferase domain-containing protein [Chloroflexota bacterium]